MIFQCLAMERSAVGLTSQYNQAHLQDVHAKPPYDEYFRAGLLQIAHRGWEDNCGHLL